MHIGQFPTVTTVFWQTPPSGIWRHRQQQKHLYSSFQVRLAIRRFFLLTDRTDSSIHAVWCIWANLPMWRLYSDSQHQWLSEYPAPKQHLHLVGCRSDNNFLSNSFNLSVERCGGVGCGHLQSLPDNLANLTALFGILDGWQQSRECNDHSIQFYTYCIWNITKITYKY